MNRFPERPRHAETKFYSWSKHSVLKNLRCANNPARCRHQCGTKPAPHRIKNFSTLHKWSGVVSAPNRLKFKTTLRHEINTIPALLWRRAGLVLAPGRNTYSITYGTASAQRWPRAGTAPDQKKSTPRKWSGVVPVLARRETENGQYFFDFRGDNMCFSKLHNLINILSENGWIFCNNERKEGTNSLHHFLGK